MAADETILEEEQEALSDDLQAELEDDMFFGEEDQPGEELTDSEDFLSEEELTDTGADELLEDDVAGDADLEDVLGEADEASSEESLTEDTLEMEEGDLEEALDEELSSEADLETEDLAEIRMTNFLLWKKEILERSRKLLIPKRAMLRWKNFLRWQKEN